MLGLHPSLLFQNQMALVDYSSISDGLMLSPVPDPFPMPRIEALLDRLGGAVFMTKLDMTKAYFQVPVAPEHVHLTRFVNSQGHWQWRYMAFGL